MGLISAIGDSVEENRNSLQYGRSGIGHIRFYQTAYAGKLPAAEVKYSSKLFFDTLIRERSTSGKLF